MYSWAQLEPSEGQYNFSIIHEDYNYLKSKGKQLFIQLQDATFNPNYKGIPAYLETDVYDGGAIYQRADSGKLDGWTAKRWNKNVQARFARLLTALGQVFDGKIEGINLQESAIGVSKVVRQPSIHSGRLTWKQEPSPKVLSANILPFISSVNFLLIANPSPVPLCLRVLLSSTW
jgi:hypothetical protein